jgi:midasin (ATPase involved in ribosome maturation)
MRVIIARYEIQSDFRIPKNIPLLSYQDNDDEGEKAWSWWIKWNTLHYRDDKGVEHEIEPYNNARDEDLKRPAWDEEEEQESDDEEEENPKNGLSTDTTTQDIPKDKMTKEVAFKVFGGELCCRCLCIMTPENDANLGNADLGSDYNHKICNSCVEATDYDWSDPMMCKVSDDIEPFRMEYEKLFCTE